MALALSGRWCELSTPPTVRRECHLVFILFLLLQHKVEQFQKTSLENTFLQESRPCIVKDSENSLIKILQMSVEQKRMLETERWVVCEGVALVVRRAASSKVAKCKLVILDSE